MSSWSKKKVFLVLIILCIASHLFAGGAREEASAPDQEIMSLRIQAQQPGTAYYNYAAILSRLLDEEFPSGSQIEVIPRGGSVTNPTLVNQGDAEVGFSASYSLAMAYRGDPSMYEGRGPHTNLTGITGALSVSHVWVVARKSYVDRTGFSTLEEMFSGAPRDWPRVGMKPQGSIVIPITDTILSTVDVSVDDLRAANKLLQGQPSQVGEMLRDNRVDLYFECVPVNHAGMTEVTLTNDLVFIELSQEAKDALAEDGLFVQTAPSGAYRGLTKDYPTPSIGNNLFAHKDASEEMIYLLTKTLVERREEFLADDASIAGWDPQQHMQPQYVTLPLHPGAKRYYDERGW